jgi:hypothetical protein
MADHSAMKLGRGPARIDHHRRALAAALFPKLPPPPDLVDWEGGITAWGMMGNDNAGDCVFAGGGHEIQVVTDQTGVMATPSDSEIIGMYESWAGYVPGDSTTDNGYVEADFLDKWLAQGYCGQKLLGHVSALPANLDHVKKGIAFFGPAYIGANLPVSAQSQDVWDVVADDGGVWGGHCMIVPQYDANGVTFITWGSLKRATWAWWNKYVDESHSLLLEAWTQRYPSASVAMLVEILNAVK